MLNSYQYLFDIVPYWIYISRMNFSNSQTCCKSNQTNQITSSFYICCYHLKKELNLNTFTNTDFKNRSSFYVTVCLYSQGASSLMPPPTAPARKKKQRAKTMYTSKENLQFEFPYVLKTFSTWGGSEKFSALSMSQNLVFTICHSPLSNIVCLKRCVPVNTNIWLNIFILFTWNIFIEEILQT